MGASEAPGRLGARRLAEAPSIANPREGRSVSGLGIAGPGTLSPKLGNLYHQPMDRSQFFSPQAGRRIDAPRHAEARFAIGDVVRHKLFDFRGVVFDIDPVFANSEEWYEAIPREMRPRRDQPFYHLLAENDDSSYVAYVSQQNLVDDGAGGPVDHPNVAQLFETFVSGRYRLRRSLTH